MKATTIVTTSRGVMAMLQKWLDLRLPCDLNVSRSPLGEKCVEVVGGSDGVFDTLCSAASDFAVIAEREIKATKVY